MKTPCAKKILNLVAALLIAVLLPKEGIGQTILELDFKTKKFAPGSLERIEKLKPGETYLLVINNINMNLYEVSLESRDTFYTSSATLPGLAQIPTDNLVSLLSKLIATTSSINATDPDLAKALEIEKNLGKTRELLKEKERELEFYSSKDNSSPLIRRFYERSITLSSDTSIESIDKQVVLEEVGNLVMLIEALEAEQLKLQETIERKVDRHELLINSIAFLSQELRTETLAVLSATNEINRLLRVLSFQKYDYYSGLNGNATYTDNGGYGLINMNFISQKTDQLMTELESHLANTFEIQAKYNALILSYSNDKDDIKIISDSFTKERMKELVAGIAALSGEISSAKKVLHNDSLQSYYLKLLFLDNNSERNYTSLPMQMIGDGQVVNIKITPRSGDFGLNSFETSFNFPTAKSYTGVSAGYYYAFNLHDDFYSIRETRALDTSYSLVKEKQSNGEVGFNALLHGGCRIKTSRFGVHASFGPGFSIGPNAQFRMMAGGGVSYGATRSKLTLDLLYITGYVMKLSDAYTEDYQSTERPTQVTVSKRNSSVALSIGYMYKF